MYNQYQCTFVSVHGVYQILIVTHVDTVEKSIGPKDGLKNTFNIINVRCLNAMVGPMDIEMVSIDGSKKDHFNTSMVDCTTSTVKSVKIGIHSLSDHDF